MPDVAQLIGGGCGYVFPPGGFAMRVTSGSLSPADSALVQNWDGDGLPSLHGGREHAADRTWTFEWIAPASDSDTVTMWVVGNSVNGMAPRRTWIAGTG